jgi:hypothetical protein
MSQITLVSNKHNDDIGISMIAELFQPSRYIIIGLVLADIVYKESTDRSTVIGRGDCTISLLTSSVPDLRLDCFCVDLNRSRRKLDPNRRL